MSVFDNDDIPTTVTMYFSIHCVCRCPIVVISYCYCIPCHPPSPFLFPRRSFESVTVRVATDSRDNKCQQKRNDSKTNRGIKM